MNSKPSPAPRSGPRARTAIVLSALLASAPAHASLFAGETLDAVANGIAWVALIIAPIVGIVVFWLVHILPEKIAEDRKHPQAKAIQTLCILSLFFGGLLWPLAWLWAYSKPVLYRMAYGVDEVEPHGHKEGQNPTGRPSISEQVAAMAEERAARVEAMADERAARVTAISQARDAEIESMRGELAELRRQLAKSGKDTEA